MIVLFHELKLYSLLFVAINIIVFNAIESLQSIRQLANKCQIHLNLFILRFTEKFNVKSFIVCAIRCLDVKWSTIFGYCKKNKNNKSSVLR